MGLRGGSGLDGVRSLPVDLASSVAFFLNDTVGLRVGWSSMADDARRWLMRSPILRGRSADS